MHWANGSDDKPTVTSGYGPRDIGFHHGVDFIGYTTVRAETAGIVTHAGFFNDESGNAVAFDLPSRGPKGETITIVHKHLADWSVTKGKSVTSGQALGTMGHTGTMAKGTHDHTEVRFWLDGHMTTKDPEAWIGSLIAAPLPVRAVQHRRAIAPVNGRKKPHMSAAVATVLPKGTVGSFDAYTLGQEVEGKAIWFRGSFSHLWFWSGGFGSGSVEGLKRI